jgi:hypothetical protein
VHAVPRKAGLQTQPTNSPATGERILWKDDSFVQGGQVSFPALGAGCEAIGVFDRLPGPGLVGIIFPVPELFIFTQATSCLPTDVAFVFVKSTAIAAASEIVQRGFFEGSPCMADGLSSEAEPRPFSCPSEDVIP